MTRKKEQIQNKEKNAEVKGLKNIDYSKEQYFPTNSKNIIKGRYTYGTDLYLITRCNYTYKVFVINDEYPEGKKYGESDNGSELLNKIPNYWD
jgi:hypothetical protein